MNTINKIYTLIIVLLISTTGCKDDFLDIVPAPPIVSADQFYLNEEQLYEGLLAAYDPLQWEFFDGNWISMVMLGEIRSDNANTGGGSDGDQTGWQQIDDFTNSELTLETRRIWTRYYFGIYRANQVIEKSANLTSSATVDRYVAEAKFLRAYYHFQLAKIYGPIPVVDKVLASDGSEYEMERNTLSEVYSQIEADLLASEDDLPTRSTMPADELGRITQGAMQALMTRVYVYWADMLGDDAAIFDKAATYAKKVVDAGDYQLINYDDLYVLDNGNSPESVWEIQHSNLAQNPSLDFSSGEYYDGNFMIQLCGIRSLCADHPDYEAGWGFMLPTQELADFYLADDQLRSNSSLISIAEVQGATTDCGSFDPYADNNPNDFEGFWQQKYANYKAFDTPVGERLVNKYLNTIDIRYADVLLLYAEALVRGNGSEADAKTIINQVRERAAGFGAYRTVDDLISQEARFNSTMDVLWYERRAEFAMEGDRWFDLVRSGRAEASLFTSGVVDKSGNFSPDDVWLPISEHDINATGGLLTAYPGSDLMN